MTSVHAQLKISENEAAGYVCDVLTGKLVPKQDKSGTWWLGLGSIGVECDPTDDTQELARLARKALAEFVVEDDDPELIDPPRFNGRGKFTNEEIARTYQLWLERKAAAIKTKSESTTNPPAPAPNEAPDRPAFPEPGRDHLEIFIEALFRHCDPDGLVQFRAFYQDG